MKLKKYFLISLILIIAIGFYSCRNFEVTHPDFKFTSGYFPYQFPVRTLVLGDYIYDNSNDNDHKFVISVHMGGVYKNEKDRKFKIEIDNELTDSLLFNTDGDTIRFMPDKYYTLNSNFITIPKGKQFGGVTVQLTDAFFDDSLTIGLSYVVPLKLVSSNDVDTILRGRAAVADPDIRITSDWVNVPKDFTLFAVKYINEFEGSYFRFGKSKVKDAFNATIEDSLYKADYVVDNPVSKLKTTKRHQVSFSTSFYSQKISGNAEMLLTFDGDNCTVSAANGSSYQISGNGSFEKKAFEWGNKERNGIVLNYSISDGNYTYEANDTLVVRDRGVVMEVFDPVKY